MVFYYYSQLIDWLTEADVYMILGTILLINVISLVLLFGVALKYFQEPEDMIDSVSESSFFSWVFKLVGIDLKNLNFDDLSDEEELKEIVGNARKKPKKKPIDEAGELADEPKATE
ncbi:hypothetical protein M3Y97_00045300 [Aphelenchoides bicaudatus]|nr:hypothetical protein M3Y97_00045300 [Aphelenchoides bicaudatus]